MTTHALDQTAPLSAERLAQIRRNRDEVSDYISAGLMRSTSAYEDRADLLAEVDRLTAEHAKAVETGQHMAEAMVKVGMTLEHAFRTAIASGDTAGMGVVIDFMSDADMLPAATEIAAQAGTENAA